MVIRAILPFEDENTTYLSQAIASVWWSNAATVFCLLLSEVANTSDVAVRKEIVHRLNKRQKGWTYHFCMKKFLCTRNFYELAMKVDKIEENMLAKMVL